MRVFLLYTLRNLWARRLTTALTVAGITLVVAVFAAVLMMAAGVEKALVDTGSDRNLIVLRKAASTELVSQIDRDAVNAVSLFPEVRTGADGAPLASADCYTVINLHKIGSGDMGNVAVRGTGAKGQAIREQVRIRDGRMFTRGTNEVVVGSNLNARFEGCGLGNELRFANQTWRIVGVFDADRSGFDSEIWCDGDVMMGAFKRPVFSSLTLRVGGPGDLGAVRDRIEHDPRLNYLDVKTEKQYYHEQSEFMAVFIRILGIVVTVIFSIGAMIGAMITMYAAVANRTVEIGTIRALGFRRRTILGAFIGESLLIAVAGWAVGVFLASFLQFFSISTVNFESFTELGFGFVLSPDIAIQSLIFAVTMGIVGGVLPAVRAARKNIVAALRAT